MATYEVSRNSDRWNVTLAFSSQPSAPRNDGSWLPALIVKWNSSRYYTTGDAIKPNDFFELPPNRPMEFFFSRGSPELLFEVVHDPTQKERPLAWFADTNTFAYLPHVDGYLLAFLPILQRGLANVTTEFRGYTYEQHVFDQNGTMAVFLNVIGNGTSRDGRMAVQATYDHLPFPANFTVETSGNAFSKPYATWRLIRKDVQNTNGSIIEMGGGANPLETFASEGQAFNELHSLLDPSPIGVPPTGGSDDRFNLSLALAAAIEHPHLRAWRAENPGGLLLTRLLWGRSEFFAPYLTAAGTYVPADPLAPTGPRAAMWFPCFHRMNISPEEPASQATRCVWVDERAETLQGARATPFPSSGSGLTLLAGPVTSPDPNRVVTPEKALAVVDRLVGGRQVVDFLEWWAMNQGDATFNIAEYQWIIHVGCFPLANPPSTMFVVDARTGLLKFGFWNSHQRMPDIGIPSTGFGDCFYGGPLPPI